MCNIGNNSLNSREASMLDGNNLRIYIMATAFLIGFLPAIIVINKWFSKSVHLVQLAIFGMFIIFSSIVFRYVVSPLAKLYCC